MKEVGIIGSSFSISFRHIWKFLMVFSMWNSTIFTVHDLTPEALNTYLNLKTHPKTKAVVTGKNEKNTKAALGKVGGFVQSRQLGRIC